MAAVNSSCVHQRPSSTSSLSGCRSKFPDRGLQEHRIESGKAQFLSGFAVQGFLGKFTVGDVPAHRGVPVARKEILGHRPFLEIDAAEPVHQMEVHHRMQRLGAAVAPGTGGLPVHQAAGLDEGQHFLGRNGRKAGSVHCRSGIYRGGTCRIDEVDHQAKDMRMSSWATSTRKNIDNG